LWTTSVYKKCIYVYAYGNNYYFDFDYAADLLIIVDFKILGFPGNPGVKGDQGVVGPKGAVGLQGPRGESGRPG